MEQSKVERVRQRPLERVGKETRQRKLVSGGEWLRVSYERRDGRVQVQYILLDPRGCVHSVLDGSLSGEAERGYNDVDEAQGTDCGSNRFSVLCGPDWKISRMVGPLLAGRG